MLAKGLNPILNVSNIVGKSKAENQRAGSPWGNQRDHPTLMKRWQVCGAWASKILDVPFSRLGK
jgi:hypothetical protein